MKGEKLVKSERSQEESERIEIKEEDCTFTNVKVKEKEENSLWEMFRM